MIVRWRRARGTRDERGSVTVVLAAVVVLGFVLTLVTLQVGAFVAQRSHAGAAADAAALAAADALARGLGPSGATAAAASVAGANGVRLERCDCAALDATVTVSMRSRLPVVPPIVARAHAVVDVSRAPGPIGSLAPRSAFP